MIHKSYLIEVFSALTRHFKTPPRRGSHKQLHVLFRTTAGRSSAAVKLVAISYLCSMKTGAIWTCLLALWLTLISERRCHCRVYHAVEDRALHIVMQEVHGLGSLTEGVAQDFARVNGLKIERPKLKFEYRISRW